MSALSRRGLLQGAAASAAFASLSGSARAASLAPEQRRFLFITTCGGWDPVCAFAPLLGLNTVHAEPQASLAQAGGVPYVSHPDRPSVDRFFAEHGAGLAVVNGLYVPSVSHSIALRLMCTGNVSAKGGDWPTRIAAAQAPDFLIPHMLIGGPGFAGEMGMFVARASSSSQLADLSSGTILNNSEVPVVLPQEQASASVSAWLQTQNSESAQARGHLSASYAQAMEQAEALQALDPSFNLSGGDSFSDQLRLGLDVLSAGLSRCVTLSHPERSSLTRWDTHSDSHRKQSELFEDLFAQLLELQERLATTAGSQGGALAEEVVVVVLSEMGRTPLLNGSGGKDHWPYTSALLFGAGIAGGQVIGAFDEGLVGQRVDPLSGAVDPGGVLMSQETLGATLMHLGGLDPYDDGYQGALLDAVVA